MENMDTLHNNELYHYGVKGMRRRAKHFGFDHQNELYHFGVKGMKWGVRHDRTPSGSSRGTNKARTDRDAIRRANIKRAVKVGAAATALGLAMYGAYRLGKTEAPGMAKNAIKNAYYKSRAKKYHASNMIGITGPKYNKSAVKFQKGVKKVGKGIAREFERDVQRTKKIPKVAKRAWKAGKEGFKDGLEKGVRASGTVLGTGAVMGITERLLRRTMGDKEGGKVFSYGRQPIKKK